MRYQYECSACETITERDCKPSQSVKYVKCQCGKRAQQVITGAPIQYMNNFFHLTGSRLLNKRG